MSTEQNKKQQEYRAARQNLKTVNISSKCRNWEELNAEVNSDPWWLGYRIVMYKLEAQSIMDAPRMGAIVNALFPIHHANSYELRLVAADEEPLFSEEDLKEAASLMRSLSLIHISLDARSISELLSIAHVMIREQPLQNNLQTVKTI